MKKPDAWRVRIVKPNDDEELIADVPICINPQPFYTWDSFRAELITVASAADQISKLIEPGLGMNDIQISMAISLKRIADALEKPPGHIHTVFGGGGGGGGREDQGKDIRQQYERDPFLRSDERIERVFDPVHEVERDPRVEKPSR